ncbi:MAG: hypothetical protein ACI89X_003908 [Planctomycetota bacterium]|jgi:hypothetical protein
MQPDPHTADGATFEQRQFAVVEEDAVLFAHVRDQAALQIGQNRITDDFGSLQACNATRRSKARR